MTAHAQPLQSSTRPASHTWLRAAGPLSLLTWPELDAAGADVAVTARSGGVSSGCYATLNLSLSVGDDQVNVLENRRRLAAGFGARPADFIFARQVHGAKVRVVDEANRGRGAFSLDDAIPEADALVTKSSGVVLAILAADCVPLVLHDPVAGVLACVHAGWRGTAAGVTAAAVAVMRDLGSHPADIIAGIGPAIAPARYQVGSDVHQAIAQTFGPSAPALIRPDPAAPYRADAGPAAPDPSAPTPAAPYPAAGPAAPDRSAPSPADAACGRWLLDLTAANRLALRQVGVPDAQIHVSNLPTGPTSLTGPTGPGHFFSDRTARPCGRHALIARLRPRPANPNGRET